jgi:adenosylmethionine-8-amino-7-oxononanoate aminotransferase
MIVAPPLVISRSQIDELLAKVVRSLDQLQQALSRDGLI